MRLADVAPRPKALGLALLLVAGGVLAIEQPWARGSVVPPAPGDLPAHLASFPAAPDFGGATGWLQSPPLDLVALRGQVVLVDFWTYSCINCIRTFPHVQGWWDAYKDRGLVVVGVHTPEFRFERDAANVAAAAQKHGLTYPIAQDNDYGVWEAYHNRYWPAKYLVDAYGRVRYTHFGEGAYAETEDAIRALLAEAGHAVPAARVEAGDTAAWLPDQTPELYAAAAQGPDRVGLEGYRPGETVTHERPAEVRRDRIFLVGTWHHGDERVTAQGEGSVLVRFRAGGANFVSDGALGACIEVRLDGAPIAPEAAGRDVRFAEGEAPCIPLDAPRSYDYYAGVPEEHLVELRVPAGFALYAFAFSPDGRK